MTRSIFCVNQDAYVLHSFFIMHTGDVVLSRIKCACIALIALVDIGMISVTDESIPVR